MAGPTVANPGGSPQPTTAGKPAAGPAKPTGRPPAAPTGTAATTPVAATPYEAKYYEELATLEHQEKNALSGDQSARTEAQANAKFGTEGLERQLPLNLKATRNRANTEGLLESGVEGERAGSVEAKYAEQRGRLAQQLKAQEDRLARAENEAREKRGEGESRARRAAQERAEAGDIRSEPREEPPTPHFAPPGGTPQPITRGVRHQAAKRAVKGRGR